MTRLLGADAILIALAIAVFGIGSLVLGLRRGRRDVLACGYVAVYTVFVLFTIATGAMIYALVTHDFSVGYVAQVGSRTTPLFYTVISLWGALEGSILFWAWVLSMYTAAVVYQHRAREGNLVPYAAATLLTIGLFFSVLLAGPANPFGLVSPVPADGPGPNPLLQNHVLMAVHPPLLYLGYVGMSVPFAFGIGALLSGGNELASDDWITLTRRWTLSAWGFLSAAIIAGMWWSYEVLGWGGYWAWDPVENASFMPWLCATAYLHSVMVQERRGMLKLWNVNLIVSTFLLTILGTFLTRSGVLNSVHAFTQGTIGYFFLAFIALWLVVTVALVAGNSGALRSTGRLDAVLSRESVFLLNNLALTVFTFTVLLGTLFPLVAEAIRGVKVSVGKPFFDLMTVPLCATLLFLMGVGPALPWKQISAEDAKRRLLVPGVTALVALVLSLVLGVRDPFAIATFTFAGFALATNVREFASGTLARMRVQKEMLPVAFVRLVGASRRRFGGYTAHLGVVTVATAIAASSTFKTEQEATLRPGTSLHVKGIDVRFDELWGREEPQRTVIAADVSLLSGGKVIGRMRPRLNFYRTQQQPVPTPAVRSRPAGDVYINLMAFEESGKTATLRVILEPLVPWIWLGGGIVCLGAMIAMAPTRRRVLAASPAPSRAPAPVRTPAPVATGSLEGAQP